MDKETWNSIPQADKEQWDKLSDKAKSIIKSAYQNNAKTPSQRANPRLMASAHEQESQSEETTPPSTDEHSGPSLEATTHERVVREAHSLSTTLESSTQDKKEPKKEEQDILSFMAQKAIAQDTKGCGLSVNNILSQPSSTKKKVIGRGIPYEHQLSAGFHELDMTGRSDETPTAEYNCWIVQRNVTPSKTKDPNAPVRQINMVTTTRAASPVGETLVALGDDSTPTTQSQASDPSFVKIDPQASQVARAQGQEVQTPDLHRSHDGEQDQTQGGQETVIGDQGALATPNQPVRTAVSQ